MIRNYLLIALRLLRAGKVYVAINVLGLSFALACCLITFLNYEYRRQFDSTHSSTGHVYRLNSIRQVEGSKQPWAVTPFTAGEALAAGLPGVTRIARLHPDRAVVQHRGAAFSQSLHYADQNLFSFFNLPLSSGSMAGFETSQVVLLSEDAARKYFGEATAVGQELTLLFPEGREVRFTVGGILAKVPANSSIQLDMAVSLEHLFRNTGIKRDDDGKLPLLTTFVELEPKASPAVLRQHLTRFASPYQNLRHDWTLKGFYLQPFRNIAFTSDVDFDGYVSGSQLEANPRGVVVIVPAIMSLLILLITCANFTNLSVAFASRRLKEISIRKVLGGRRRQVAGQFLTENLLLSYLAAVLSLCLVKALLPAFNHLTGLDLRINLFSGSLGLFLLLLPLFTALVAGLYPAWYLSGLSPVSTLKGGTTVAAPGRFTRLLLLGQLTICCLSLVAGITLTQNALFQQKVDYGYDLRQIAVVPVEDIQAFHRVSRSIAADVRVEAVAGTAQQIADGSYPATLTNMNYQVRGQVAHVGGADYLKAMGIRLLQGRHFHPGATDREGAVLVNQTAVKALGLREPVGSQIRIDSAYFTVAGVVADYKEFGLHGLVPPCVLRLAGEEEYNFVVVRAAPGKLTGVVQTLQTVWQQVVPGVPYSGYLQTDLIEKERYLNEGFQSVAFFLAVVTILLSASGLFALVSLNIMRRSKEIGVRKVMGASVLEIMALLNRQLVKLVLVAFAFGSLAGYLLIDKLIFRFILVYHSPISPFVFAIALLVITLSAGLTVGLKVFRAARLNPVDVLKND
jgi:hypothetical protein